MSVQVGQDVLSPNHIANLEAIANETGRTAALKTVAALGSADGSRQQIENL